MRKFLPIILFLVSTHAALAQTAIGVFDYRAKAQICPPIGSELNSTGIVWPGPTVQVFKARIMNQANWSPTFTPTGLWLIYLDPGSIYNNATGYVAAGGNAQICPASQPKCGDQLITLAKLDLHPGTPYVGPDYDWPVPVTMKAGDSIDFDMPCFGSNVPADFIGEIFYSYAVTAPTLVSLPGAAPEVYLLSNPNINQALLPADWNPAHNQIINYGGSGSTGAANAANLAPGAGGGAAAWVNNVNATAGATIGFQVGPAGLAAGRFDAVGPTPGGDTFLCLSAPCNVMNAIVKAPGGGAGIPGASDGGVAGQGGQTSAAIGDGAFSGGNGSVGVDSSHSGAGGGCAGHDGPGGNASGATGGQADGSIGPAGGAGGSPPGAGISGNLYAAGVGPGSGAGAFTTSAGPGQAGGSFCGAPSGGRQFGAAGINGQNGAIVLLNWPAN